MEGTTKTLNRFYNEYKSVLVENNLSAEDETANESKALNYLYKLTELGLFDENIEVQLLFKEYVTKFISKTPLTAIDVDPSNFATRKGFLPYVLEHKRCDDIFMISGQKGIINGRAYGYTVRHQYDDKLKTEIPLNHSDAHCDYIYPLSLAYNHKNTEPTTIKLFISKGGIVTGEYIDLCYIRSKTKYVVRDPINIPISLIAADTDELMDIMVVDHREPKLKALMEFYDCPIKHKNIHFNIRSYKKLKNH